MAKGLDGRERDENGQIRKKSGAAKMRTLAATYPELSVFSAEATLKGVERRHGLDGLEQVRELGKRKQREQK